MSPVTRLVHRAEPTKSRRNRVPATLHCFTENSTSHMTVVESIVWCSFWFRYCLQPWWYVCHNYIRCGGPTVTSVTIVTSMPEKYQIHLTSSQWNDSNEWGNLAVRWQHMRSLIYPASLKKCCELSNPGPCIAHLWFRILIYEMCSALGSSRGNAGLRLASQS